MVQNFTRLGDNLLMPTQRKRRIALKKALAEIASTGSWEVKDGYQITRKGDFKRKKIEKLKK